MELSKEHRGALLIALNESQEDEAKAVRLMRSEEATKEYFMCAAFEISHYLTKQRIETIKQALITNEIDY